MNKDRDYHQRRSGLRYYGHVRRILDQLSPAGSIADVGGGPMTVAGAGTFEQRTLIDRRLIDPVTIPTGVDVIESDWFDVPGDRVFDVITCLQVVEHVETYELAERFVRKLLSQSQVAIISVPWRWRAGPGHPQDPMDLTRLIALAGAEPESARIVREASGPARVVTVFTESSGIRERFSAGIDS